jgi:hypothetical protein
LGAGWRDPWPYYAAQCGAITLLTATCGKRIGLSTAVNDLFFLWRPPPLTQLGTSPKQIIHENQYVPMTRRKKGKNVTKYTRQIG